MTLVCCSGTLLAGGPAAPGNPVVDIQREAALASRDVYYNLRELPGSRNLYMSLYELHAYSKGIQVPCERDAMILDDLVHEVEFILDRMQVPAFDPVCAYQRRCAPVRPHPGLEHVSAHVIRLRELVDLLMLPPGPPEAGPGQYSEQPAPGQPVPQDIVPEKHVPQEVPGKNPPPAIPENYVPQEAPGQSVPPVIPSEAPKQYEEQLEGPGVVIPGNPYRELEEVPLNQVPQPNPTDVLITPNQPFDVSVSSPQRENARPNTNPDLNRDEYLPEVLPVIPQETESGPLLVTP